MDDTSLAAPAVYIFIDPYKLSGVLDRLSTPVEDLADADTNIASFASASFAAAAAAAAVVVVAVSAVIVVDVVVDDEGAMEDSDAVNAAEGGSGTGTCGMKLGRLRDRY